MKRNRKKKRNTASSHTRLITALVANQDGEIFDLPGYAAVGRSGSELAPLTVDETLDMPYGSELMFLPDRRPVLYNLSTGDLETVADNPYDPGTPLFPVAAFNSPGYVLSHVSAYQERPAAGFLPLFAYGAAGWFQGRFRSAVILVDSEKRQDLRLMKTADVQTGVNRMRQVLPENRLCRHLEKCALEYGCPAGKNFFLARYEAPLPTSRACNARCLGCISLQKTGEIKNSQDRIGFTPTPAEIAEIALEHIPKVPGAVVSFGQGCEGDPLLAAKVIEPAIRLIRSKTSLGTINMNTNGSLPAVMEKLFDAGLDAVRISMNSVRRDCYEAYFRPHGYRFADVLEGIDRALGRGKFVSINYLNCPGFTDTPAEVDAFIAFREKHPVHFIQWRNLNFDPLRYVAAMDKVAAHGRPIGMKTALERIRRRFPDLGYGYFNPPKEKWATVPREIFK